MIKITVILICVFQFQYFFGQTIDKDSAISIAIKNGLEKGLEEPTVQLENDVWIVKCLICAELYYSQHQIIKVNALTGEIIENTGNSSIGEPFGSESDKTKINFPKNSDSVKTNQSSSEPERLTTLDNGNENNAELSPDNKMIAFSYNNDIYTVDIISQNERIVCKDCYKPFWIDNEWLLFVNRSEYKIYKVNLIIDPSRRVEITEDQYREIKNRKSNNGEWYAYISNEVWDIPIDTIRKGFRKIIQYSYVSGINGQDMELCLKSKITGKTKYVTKTGKYVHSPTWTDSGDTLLFYIEKEKYFIDNFESDTIKYSKFNGLENITLWDYKKVSHDLFPYVFNCKIYAINLKTLTPSAVLIDKRGRYSDVFFTDNLEYLIYSEKNCGKCDNKLWKLKLK